MADDDTISSFAESGYFKGCCQIISLGELVQEADEQDEYLASLPNGSNVSIGRVVLTVLHDAVLAKADYIHINPTRVGTARWSEFLVRYRINSKLWEANAFAAHIYAPFCARLKIISSINIAERRVPQFGRFLWEQYRIIYEMRLSSIPTQSGEAFVINILPNSGQGDYTEERHEWQDNMTVEEIYANILTKRQEKPE